MNRFRRISPLFALALVPLAGCGRGPAASGAGDLPGVTVPNVGVLPERAIEQPAAVAEVAEAPAPAPAVTSTTDPDRDDESDTTEVETTEPESTDADDGDRDSNDEDGAGANAGPASVTDVDPERAEWLEFTEEADPDTFAGGADLEDLIDGPRVLMIGDSVMASTSSRYGGEMCDTLVPEGWHVEVDAETGRFVDFGESVLDERLEDDFDIAVVMLGNNYGANPDVFDEYLREIVDRLEPRPTLLYTVTLYQPNRADVNEIIYDIAMDNDNVRVIDWAGETEEHPNLTAADGLHLSDPGRKRYAELVAEELGDAPGRVEGECLRSSFTDDSAGTGNTGPTEGQVTMPPSSWPSNSGGGGTGTTVPRPTTVPGGGGTTVPGGTDTSPPGGDTTPPDTGGAVPTVAPTPPPEPPATDPPAPPPPPPPPSPPPATG